MVLRLRDYSTNATTAAAEGQKGDAALRPLFFVNIGQFAIMQLASGESVSWTQNFCDCFELDEGNYELSLSVQLKDPNGEIVFLKVNDLAFEIL